MKKFVFMVLFFLLFFSIFAGSDDSIEEVVSEKVYEALQEDDVVEVVVYFKDDGLESQKSDRVLSTLDVREGEEEVFDFDLKYEYQSLNGMSGLVSKEGLEKLESNPDVEKVYKTEVVSAFLDQSVSMINGTLVVAKQIDTLNEFADINITGLDQTICVIDTGLDYTREGLGGCFGSGCKVVDGYNWVDDEEDPMDDNGHGTHVGSTAAGNHSELRGVAPDARLVGLKVLGNNGTGSTADVIAALDWCVGNMTSYNITTVVMSLGTTALYASACDGADTSGMASASNDAVDAGLFVAVAAGNNGNTTGISSPACASKVTSVSSVDDGSPGTTRDTVSSFSNTNGITDIFAPGKWINAEVPLEANCANSSASDEVCSDSGNNTLQGTSQAAPHVAGAAMLLLQYKKLENGTSLLPQQVENALKNSTIFLNDLTDTYTIPRLDVIASLDYIDNGPPLLVIGEPQNTTYDASTTTVYLNLSTYDIFLDSTFYSLDGATNTTFTGNTTVSVTQGSHTLTVYANDTSNNINQTEITFFIDNTGVTLLHPTENQNISTSNITFLCHSSSDVTIDNITVYHSLTGTFAANETVSTSNSSVSAEFNFNETLEGNYTWNCLATLSNTTELFANQNFTFTLDATSPVIDSISLSKKFVKNNTNVTVVVNSSDASTGIANLTAEGTALTFSDELWSSTVELTDDTLDIVVTDYANNILTNSSTDYVVDNTAPNITLTTPAQDATGVSRDNNITITYSEDLNETTLNSSSILFLDTDSRDIGFRIYYVDNQTVIEPNARLQENASFTLNITSLVTDWAENEMDSFKLTFNTSARDTDGDGTADTEDSDDDDDSIDDTLDFLTGNLTTVDADFEGLSLVINGSTNSSFPFEGSTELRFFKDDVELLDFTFTFANTTLLVMDNVSLRIENDTAEAGGIAVEGLIGVSKTVYINNLSILNGVCVKNESATSLEDVNKSCTGSSEFFVPCPGSKQGVSCATNGTKLKVSGITNSIVIQQNDTIAPVVSGISTSESGNSTEKRVTLSVTTDESANCRVATSDVAYESMVNMNTTGSTTAHSYSENFIADRTVTYRVRCQDDYSNTMQESATASYTADITEEQSSPSPTPSPDSGTSTTTSTTSSDSSEDTDDTEEEETVEEETVEEEIEETTPTDQIVEKEYTLNYTSTDLKAIIEINDGLKKGLKKVLGIFKYKFVTENSPEILENITSKRIIDVKENSTLSLTFSYNGGSQITNFMVYDEVPKEFAQNSSSMIVTADGAEVTVVEGDPILMFLYPVLEPGKTFTISYAVEGSREASLIESISNPYFLVQDEELPFLIDNQAYVEGGLAVLLIAAASFFLGKRTRKKRRVKKEKDFKVDW